MRNKPLWPFTLNQASPQANGLVGWWPGGNGGYRLLDMSGRGNHGTLTNFAAPMSATSGWAAGNGGGKSALATDGTDDHASTTAISLTGLVNVSFAVWAYRSSASVTVGAGRASGPVSGSAGGRFSFVWFSDGNLYVSCDNGASFVYGSVALTGTGWRHIAVCYDGSQSTNATRLIAYVDGRAQSLSFVGTTPTSLGTPTTETFGVGRDGTNRFCGGSYEDLRLYLRTLSAAEVAGLYNPATRWQLRSQRKFVFQGADLTSHVETFTTPGSGTWTPPASVTSYVVECIGGGGAGGYSYDSGGGGGGGGGYARSTRNCTAGVGINYQVGAGAVGQVSYAEDTWFVNSSTVVAYCGSDGGVGSGSGGGGGGSGGALGDIAFSGGNGGSGYTGGGGGGGSSAGSDSGGNVGTNGDIVSGGTGGAAVTDGGVGGDGGAVGNPGISGANPGAGGGGDALGGGTGYGTNGGNGWIRVSYIAVTVTATQSLISRCMSIPMSICTR